MSRTLLEVKHLKKYFKVKSGVLHAVDDVSFTVEKGKTIGIVGESGCGKSTLGRVILHLHDRTDGQIIFNGEDISNASPAKIKELRSEMQMIFQDPFSSINPRKTVGSIIGEPMQIYHTCSSKAEYRERVLELMNTVGLESRVYNAFPHELDGGKRQRIGIARALAIEPKFIICDEPVSALDVSIQAQILNLMMDLQESRNLTYMFITHDLSVVKHISDDICVMYLGTVVERAPTNDLFKQPLHPYTKALLSAIPIPSLHHKRKRIILKGEITSPVNLKKACRFAPRCIYATDKCHCEEPELREINPGHFVQCHYVEEINSREIVKLDKGGEDA